MWSSTASEIYFVMKSDFSLNVFHKYAGLLSLWLTVYYITNKAVQFIVAPFAVLTLHKPKQTDAAAL